MKRAKVITVTSVKGGVGKTTTLLSLAGIYAISGKKVLIIDADLYSSSISLCLDLEPINDIYTLTDDMNNNRYTEFEKYITKYNDEIDVISGPKDIRQSSRVISSYIPSIISKAAYKYDVILIDTNHFLNELNLTIFEESDEMLYIITNEAVDLKNMRSMISIYKDMGRSNYSILLNESIFKGRHVYTKYDVDKFLHRDVDYYISDKFNIKNIDNYILEGKIITLDKKIRTIYKKSISSLNYIANSLLEKNKEE